MRQIILATAVVSAAASLAIAQTPASGPFASAADQQAAMASGKSSSEGLTRAALARIAAMDRTGPRLNAVIALNPQALADARARDLERKAGKAAGPLFGVPILLKDNIETADGTATTAGSLALADNVTGRDAPLSARLKAGGAVILGKANLSEWANFRGANSLSGWSAVGGQVRNPHSLDRSPCGSSAGSGAAVAAGYVAAAIGTETDGSITCPAAANGLVGFKPTVGLVSRTGIVPISPEQDTAGPMTRTVRDAAAVMTVIAGSDPADPATREADARKVNYVAALDASALKGVRIGVMRGTDGGLPAVQAVFEHALAQLRDAGAILVEVKRPEPSQRQAISAGEDAALKAEFKVAIDAYLATTPKSVSTRTLDQLIAFNRATPAETPLFGQEIFEQSARSPSVSDPKIVEQRANAKRLAGPEGIDRMLKEADVEIIVAASGGPAFFVDVIGGDRYGGSASGLPAVAGYPHLTVPMGEVRGMPVGLSFIGTAWSDARVLSLGYAFEQKTRAWRAPGFYTNAAARPEFAPAFDHPAPPRR